MKKQIQRNQLSPYNISTLQLQKQIMSSKEQTMIEEQDQTSGKARNRQAMSGKEKQMGKQYI